MALVNVGLGINLYGAPVAYLIVFIVFAAVVVIFLLTFGVYKLVRGQDH